MTSEIPKNECYGNATAEVRQSLCGTFDSGRSTIKSDGYRSYIFVLAAFDHKHKKYDPNSGMLKWLHTMIGNVKDVDDYEAVRNRIQAIDIGWERYDFLDNTSMSDTMTENFGEFEKMSSLILILVCISGIVIICLVGRRDIKM